VALDLTITPDLQSEGDARELVNRIQTLRKEAGLLVTDRITVAWSGPEKMNLSFNAFRAYICAEILADALEWQPKNSFGTQIEVNDTFLTLHITKKEH
jgi:isoleucyl-tRNA synthetase